MDSDAQTFIRGLACAKYRASQNHPAIDRAWAPVEALKLQVQLLLIDSYLLEVMRAGMF